MRKILITLLFCFGWAPVWAISTEPTEVGDLPGQFDLPEGSPKAVIVLLHGSGAHSRDEDLTAVTEGGVPNLFFADLSSALTDQGLAVLRYDKRNYALTRAEPRDEEALQKLKQHPCQTYIADARAALESARRRFPGLPVALLGHSEGTWVALQAASQDGEVSAVGLISFSGAALETLVQEQVAHRYRDDFDGWDANRDGRLEASEQPDSLAQQLAVLDADQDQAISYSEFQAGNCSNIVLTPIISDGWRSDEGALPTATRLVTESSDQLLFFQGLWDNQTPAYYTQALEICERQAWKKGNKSFHYFERAGHALDPRKSWGDTTYRPTPPETLERVARAMAEALD